MPRYLLPLLAAAALHAGVMDFHTLAEAKAAYEKGDYAKASEYYGELGDKNDAARYNYADALYQQKKYKEAAKVFSQIASPALKQKALHNLGNSLALSGKTDDALKAYEAALKLGEDKDTRYNLELLQKQKQQQQQNDQNQKEQDQNNDQQNGQNKEGQQDQKEKQRQNAQNGQDKGHPQQSAQEENKPQNRDGENNQDREGQAQSQPEQAPEAQKQQSQNASEAEKQPDESAEEKERKTQNAAQAQAAAAQPISDMEERKYNKMLDKRGIKTLMIPLSGKGEPHADETTPW